MSLHTPLIPLHTPLIPFTAARMLAVLFWVVVVVCPEEFGVVVKGLTIPRQTRYAHIGQIPHDLDRLDDLPHLNNLAHLDDLFIAHLDIDLSRLSGSYICRLRYCAWRAVSQIPPGNHVRKSCAIQIPRGKHDLDRTDHVNQGCIWPEKSTSLKMGSGLLEARKDLQCI